MRGLKEQREEEGEGEEGRRAGLRRASGKGRLKNARRHGIFCTQLRATVGLEFGRFPPASRTLSFHLSERYRKHTLILCHLGLSFFTKPSETPVREQRAQKRLEGVNSQI